MEQPGSEKAGRRKRRANVKSTSMGFVCINTMMNRVIGKVLTKARQRDKSREWGVLNRQRRNDNVKRWKENHRDEHLAATRRYNQSRIQQTLDYQKQRRQTDTAFAIKCRMRARLGDCLKKGPGSKADHTMSLVACTSKELVDHLKKQLVNFDTALHHVGHIFPFRVFDVENEEHQRRVMHWSNTQPLTQSENSSKTNHLPTKAMASKVERWAWPDGITEDMLPDIYPGWSTPLRM